MQDEARAAVLQPGVMAAVALDEHPGLRHAGAAGAVTRRPPDAGAAQACGPEDAVDRRVGEGEAFPLREEFGQVLVVDPRVPRSGEPDDAGAGGVIDAPGRGAAAVPVDQGLGPSAAIRAAQATDLPSGEGQEVGRFRDAELAAVQGVEDDELLLGAWRQGNHPPRIRLGWGRTFSLRS